MIRVLILDDSLVQRAGIAKVVEDTKAMTVVGSAATSEEALAILRQQPVDLAMVDLVLDNQSSGLEVGREMCRVQPKLKAIIYTSQRGGWYWPRTYYGRERGRGSPDYMDICSLRISLAVGI